MSKLTDFVSEAKNFSLGMIWLGKTAGYAVTHRPEELIPGVLGYKMYKRGFGVDGAFLGEGVRDYMPPLMILTLISNPGDLENTILRMGIAAGCYTAVSVTTMMLTYGKFKANEKDSVFDQAWGKPIESIC